MNRVELSDLPAELSKLVSEKGAETLLGEVMTTQGLLLLFFSHRLNQDFPLLVSGTDPAKILARVYEILAAQPGVGL